MKIDNQATLSLVLRNIRPDDRFLIEVRDHDRRVVERIYLRPMRRHGVMSDGTGLDWDDWLVARDLCDRAGLSAYLRINRRSQKAVTYGAVRSLLKLLEDGRECRAPEAFHESFLLHRTMPLDSEPPLEMLEVQQDPATGLVGGLTIENLFAVLNRGEHDGRPAAARAQRVFGCWPTIGGWQFVADSHDSTNSHWSSRLLLRLPASQFKLQDAIKHGSRSTGESQALLYCPDDGRVGEFRPGMVICGNIDLGVCQC